MLVSDKNRGVSMLRARPFIRPRSFAGNPERRLRLEPLEDRVLLSGDIHTIQHVIVIMQENRSFDSYFGTYPGADGIPMNNGVPTVCVPEPAGGCQMPYHDPADVNGGGPHNVAAAREVINGGAMDGFIKVASKAKK